MITQDKDMDYSIKMPPSSSGEWQTGSATSSSSSSSIVAVILQKDQSRALLGWVELDWVGHAALVGHTRITETAPLRTTNQSSRKELGRREGGREEGGARRDGSLLPSLPPCMRGGRRRLRLALRSTRAIHDAGHCSLVSERASSLPQKG